MKYRTIVADPPWPYLDNPLPVFGPGRLPRFLPYETMPVAEIEALPMSSLAAPGAHLYLWTTNRFLWTARGMLDRWGLSEPQVLVWCKAPMGLGPGGAFANTAEFILFARWRVGGLIAQARNLAGLGRADVHRAIFGSKPTGIVYRWEADDCLPSEGQWETLCGLLPGLERGLAAPPSRHASTWFQWPRGAHSAKPAAFLDLVEQVSPSPRLELFARTQRLGWDTWGNEALNHVQIEVPTP